MNATEAKVLSIHLAVSEAVRELGSIPSGHLYAQLMGLMSLETYQSVLRTLQNAGLVEVQSHVVRWTGPRS